MTQQDTAAPWQVQADAMRTALAVNPALNKRIESLQAELRQRTTDVKLRDQKLDEANARFELMERRMQSARLGSERVAQVRIPDAPTSTLARTLAPTHSPPDTRPHTPPRALAPISRPMSRSRPGVLLTRLAFSWRACSQFEAEIAKLKKQEAVYAEAMETLQNDLDALEQENAVLKKQTRRPGDKVRVPPCLKPRSPHS